MKTKTEKIPRQTLYFDSRYLGDIRWGSSYTPQQLRDAADQIEKDGFEYISIEVDTYDDYGGPSIEVKETARRQETDEEYNKRVEVIMQGRLKDKERQKADAAKRKKEKYELFLKLKKQFEK